MEMERPITKGESGSKNREKKRKKKVRENGRGQDWAQEGNDGREIEGRKGDP